MDQKITMRARLRGWFRTLVALARTPAGARILRLANWALVIGVAAYLVLALRQYGLGQVVTAFPTTPWFYVLFALLYVSLPISEWIIYRLCWKDPLRGSLGVFLKKRVYNRDVMGYSGEVYFFSWAQKNVGLGRVPIMETIRDTNIVSSLASTAVAILLVGVYLFRGEINIGRLIGDNGWYVAVIGVIAALLIPVVIRFRRYVFSMPRRLALQVFGIYVVRLIIGQVLQIAQWAVVLPGEPLRVWFTFAAIAIIVSRLPFVSNQNLLFMGAGVTIAGRLGLPTVEVAAMLLATAVLDKVVNIIAFVWASYAERHQIGKSMSIEADADLLTEQADPLSANPDDSAR